MTSDSGDGSILGESAKRAAARPGVILGSVASVILAIMSWHFVGYMHEDHLNVYYSAVSLGLSAAVWMHARRRAATKLQKICVAAASLPWLLMLMFVISLGFA